MKQTTPINLIVADLETSGLTCKHSILSLGAVHYETGAEFYGECSIFPGALVDPESLKVNGFTIEETQPGKKQTPAALFWSFIEWAKQFPDCILAGHNIGHFDILFLEEICSVNFQNLKFPFSFRTVDLPSVAFFVLGKSLKHSDICRALGIPPEPKPHNALEGARSEAAAFRELYRIKEMMVHGEIVPECRVCGAYPCSCGLQSTLDGSNKPI